MTATALDFPDCRPCQLWEAAGASWPRPCAEHYGGEPDALPVLLSEQAAEYGTFTVAVVDDLRRNRHVALTDPPPATAWSVQLLEAADPNLLTWDGRKITVSLDNGSWVWVAEGQSPHGDVIYARWPD